MLSDARNTYRVLLVICLVIMVFAVGYRVFVLRRSLSGEPLFFISYLKNPWTTSLIRPSGSWNRVDSDLNHQGNSDNNVAGSLQGLGYQAGYEKASGQKGVMVHRPGESLSGLNLYVSGHAPEAVLMDMRGEVLHRWQLPWQEAFSQQPKSYLEDPEKIHHWRKAYVYPNGDLLAILGKHGLVKVDRNSNLLWSRANQAHHDLAVSSNGEIYVLTYEPTDFPAPGSEYGRLDDVIKVYGPDGTLRRKYSILKAFKRSDYHGLLGYGLQKSVEHREHSGELFHTNSIELLSDTGLPTFAEGGDVLLSFKTFSAVAVMDLDRERIVWALAGMTGTQHDATLLENGRLLFFDNGKLTESSRVIEVDPVTQNVVWQYGDREGEHFYTACCGTNQRLSNGNTLITDTESGRAFEVTPGGNVVWEFVSPHRAGENDELAASLFELKRYPHGYFADWLEGPARETNASRN